MNPAMPNALDPIIGRLLAKDRAQRYLSAEDLLADLEAVQGSSSPSSAVKPTPVPEIPPASVPPPVAPEPRRARMGLMVIGALIVVVVGGAFFLLRGHLGTKPAP